MSELGDDLPLDLELRERFKAHTHATLYVECADCGWLRPVEDCRSIPVDRLTQGALVENEPGALVIVCEGCPINTNALPPRTWFLCVGCDRMTPEAAMRRVSASHVPVALARKVAPADEVMMCIACTRGVPHE